uniref:Thioredoxin domain-containing protein 17 n=2 Tax=Lygus hesperus TaxID=30085 RepID=A0A146MD47_LYGHE
MSIEKHTESDFCKVTELADNLDGKGDSVFLLFMASRREDGVRWCPDCVKAEPVIDGFLEKCSLTKNAHLIVVDLEKTYLRDPTNPYYTSEKFCLRKVPTLMAWKGTTKLEEEDCMSESLLKNLFQCVL